MGLQVLDKFFFCIPSKVGLLIYGYINLILTVLEIYLQYATADETYTYYYMCDYAQTINNDVKYFMFVIESIFTIVFISGIYMNNLNSLKIFFWYKIISLVVFLGVNIFDVFIKMAFYEDLRLDDKISGTQIEHYLLTSIIILSIAMALMIYILVVLRRYYVKLENELTKDSEELYKSSRCLLPADRILNDDFEEFTNETFKIKPSDS